MTSSKVDQLPVELLSYIFVLGTHSDYEDSGDEEKDLHISPCMPFCPSFRDCILSVCTRWRQIALSTPQLWNKLCITIEDASRTGPFETSEDGELVFETVLRDLAQSRCCPLDILIDARDPDWNFAEFDWPSPSTDDAWIAIEDSRQPGYREYKHPFSARHMKALLATLHPYISRWRSLAILVDRWTSMQAALEYLSGPLSDDRGGPAAPMLESLVLMRCNEWVSCGHKFIPTGFANPYYLPFGAALHSPDDLEPSCSPLPRLRNLVLWGTHVDWPKLPLLLPVPSSQESHTAGLRSLELAYHCGQVRQTQAEFRKILERCPMLEELTVRLSGPRRDDDLQQDSIRDNDVRNSVVLPHLSSLVLGYDSRRSAMNILCMIRFPNLRQLSLENRGHWTEYDSDAGPILDYCINRMTPTPNSNSARAMVVSASASATSLDTLNLDNVGSRWQTFATFFTALPKLTSLTLRLATACAIEALQPQFRYVNVYDPPTPVCPCPKLEHLTISGTGDDDLFASCSKMAEDRSRAGMPIRDIRFSISGMPLGDDEDEDGLEAELGIPRSLRGQVWNAEYDWS